MSSLKSLPIIAGLVLMVSVAVSCGDNNNERITYIDDARHTPTMLTTDVSTYVSDSGYTRYHITAPLWTMYEEADTPHWTFPEGLFLEKFDDDMNTNATFRADSATYMSSLKLWRFDGNVNMRNTDGDRFATQQLFWDQNVRRVYSDSFMHIERSERIIEGYGFESNEAMTEYTVLHPQMILPIDRMKAEREERRATDSLPSASCDSTISVPSSSPSTNPSPKAVPPRRHRSEHSSGDTIQRRTTKTLRRGSMPDGDNGPQQVRRVKPEQIKS